MNEPKMMRVRVTRSFFYQKHRGEKAQPVKVGEELDLPELLAISVIAANKAEKVEEKPRTDDAEKTEKKTPPPPDDKKGGKSHAK